MELVESNNNCDNALANCEQCGSDFRWRCQDGLHKMADHEDAGPVDPSVLAEQHLHRSAFIRTEGYRVVKFSEHGRKLNQWELDHPAVLDLLRQSGFYGVARLRRVQLDQALLGALAERWRQETQTFHFRHGEMTITLQDVAVISGLRVHGAPVTGSALQDWQGLCVELLGAVPDDISGGQIRLDWLHQRYHHINLDAPAGVVAATARAYMLYQIGCSLFPNPTGYRVHLKWLPLLDDFAICGAYAWGAATLAYLYRALGPASLNGKDECCCFGTLLQIWAWDHIHIGRPTGVLALPDIVDRPLGCRWGNAGGLRFGANVRTTDIEFYRDELDQQREAQVIWMPYTDEILATLSEFCVQGSQVWRARTVIICFHIVEMHVPDRVLRQFGLLQHIPLNVESIRRVTSRGRPDKDWIAFHATHIERWSERLDHIVDQLPAASEDPLQAASIYMQWYWTITRRWISRPVQRPPLTFHPRGHIERTLADTLRHVDTIVSQLLHDRPSRAVTFRTLADMRENIHMVLQNVPIVPTVRVSGGRGDYAHASSSSHHVPRSPSPPIQVPTTFPSTSASLPPPVSRTSFTSTYSRRRLSSSSPQEIQHIAEHDESGIIEKLDQLAAVEHLDDIPIMELAVPRGRGRGRGRRRGRRGRGRAQN